MKKLFLLLAVALVLPSATACACSNYTEDEHQICHYLKREGFSPSEREMIIQEMADSGGSLDGNFNSILDKPIENTIKLNKLEEINPKVSDENKKFLIDFSSISIFGYIVYSFLKKYYLLLRLL